MEANNTFGTLADEWLVRQKAQARAEATIEKNRWILENLASTLRHIPVRQITPLDVLKVLQRVRLLPQRVRPGAQARAADRSPAAEPSRPRGHGDGGAGAAHPDRKAVRPVPADGKQPAGECRPLPGAGVIPKRARKALRN